MYFDKAYGTADQLPASTLPEVALAGRSNAGKSSLVNGLARQNGLARVAQAPGKTTTINFYHGGNHYIVDLPGYGFAKRPPAEKQRWAQLCEGYFGGERKIKLVVQLLDARHSPSTEDKQMLEFLQGTGVPFVCAVNKFDKLNKAEQAEQVQYFKEHLPHYEPLDWFPISCLTGEGIDKIRRIIAAKIK
jgi:GTP-binding protein